MTGEGITREVVTDENGRFFVDGLPLGSYRLSLVRPGWAFGPSVRSPVALTAGCAHLLLDVTQKQSSVTGRIEPTPGHALTRLPVQLMPIAAGVTGRPPAGSLEASGAFRIDRVEPGEYWVAINPGGVPRPTGRDQYLPALPYAASYYPGKPTKEEATPIRVERGTDVALPGVWILPPPLAEKRVELLVRRATGEAFPDARVIIRDSEGNVAVNRAGPTPATGLVQFNVIEGRTYRIEAATMDSNRRPRHYAAMELRREDEGPLVLTLVDGVPPPESYLLFLSPMWTAVLERPAAR